MSRVVSRLMFGCTLAIASGASWAASFSVFPLKVALNAQKTTEILTVQNAADQPLRLQVEGKSWSINAQKQWSLQDTDALILTPELLVVPPHGSALIRVGIDAPASDQEQAYRLLLTELTDASAVHNNGTHLTVRTQLSLPLFVDPGHPIETRPSITQVHLTSDHLAVTIQDTGTRRLDAQASEISVLTAAGKVLEHKALTTGYALPGTSVDLDLDVPASVCPSASVVSITFSDPVSTQTRELAPGDKACGPKGQ